VERGGDHAGKWFATAGNRTRAHPVVMTNSARPLDRHAARAAAMTDFEGHNRN